MGRICPNCNHTRKATDEAPDWQCPACELAYNKGAGAASRENYGRLLTPTVNRPRAERGKWLFLLVVLAAGVWAGKPVWQNRAQATAIEVAAAQPEVVLYATQWCGYCAAARDFFSANGIQFTELDIEKSSAGYEGHRKLGGNGVPLVVVGDKVIHGYNEGALRSTLKPWLKKS